MKEEALVSSRDITQIGMDVNRTFGSHTMFWARYGVRSGSWAGGVPGPRGGLGASG